MKFISLLAISALALLPFSAYSQSASITSREVFAFAGPPVTGVNEVDTLTIGGTPTSGTFRVTITGGTTSAPITWSATNATLLANIDAALEGMNEIGTGGVVTAALSLTAGVGTITLTFGGGQSNASNTARRDIPALTATSSLVGTSPTTAIATTTAGVAGTWNTAPPGTLIEDITNGALYQNVSTTAYNAVWASAVVNKQTTYTADGAIAIQSGQVILDKSSALAMTVAAPTAEQAGTRITITNNNDVAHVVTFTGTTLLDGTTGANITATFAAFKGSTITVLAVNLKWHVESLQVVTAAP